MRIKRSKQIFLHGAIVFYWRWNKLTLESSRIFTLLKTFTYHTAQA